MNIKRHIPNAITCCNLLCGCLAIVQAFEGNLVWAAYLVGLAAIFDFFDGFAARLLRVTSPIGKDLDSLADMVTFGVVPGIIMFHMISMTVVKPSVTDYDTPGSFTFASLNFQNDLASFLCYVAFIIPIFSAIRLAKFNNDTRQTTSFIGVPTPANAIFIASLGIIFIKYYIGRSTIETCHQDYGFIQFLDWIFNPIVLCIMSGILSILLVSEIPLFALKFKFFGWKGNRTKYVFLAISVLLLVTLQFVGIPLIIILYVLISLITNAYLKRKVVS